MRGVAEQRDTALAPILNWWPVTQHPHLPRVHFLQQRAHWLAFLSEAHMQLFWIAVTIPAFLVAVRMKHSDKVEQLASPERVMHEMSLLATPDDHLGNAIVLWPLGYRKHGTIGDVAGHIGLAIANDLFAYGGPQAVAADHCRSPVNLAAFGTSGDNAAIVFNGDDLL